MGRRIAKDRRRVEQRRRVERFVVHQPGCAGVDEHSRIRPLVPGRVRVGHDDHGQAERSDLGQRGRARSSDDEVGGRKSRQHLVAQERIWPVPLAHVGRECLATGQGVGVPRVARQVQDVHLLDQAGQGLRDRGVEPADRLRPSEDQQHSRGRPDAKSLACRDAVDGPHVADGGARDEAGPPRGLTPPETEAGLREGHREDVREAGSRPDAPARHHVSFPHHDRHALRCGRDQHGNGDVTAGREDRGRSLTRQHRHGLRDGRGESNGVEDGVDREVDGAERAQGQQAQGETGRPDDRGLEPTMAAEPAELRPVRTSAERPGDGQGRVDVPARAPARDQQTHRSRSLVRRSRARSTAGFPPRPG